MNNIRVVLHLNGCRTTLFFILVLQEFCFASVPILAFENRDEYDEYFWPGIYSKPHKETMKMLEKASTLQDIINNIPDNITEEPDIIT